MNRFLNIGLLSNPLNWITVFLMCFIALFFLALVAPQSPET